MTDLTPEQIEEWAGDERAGRLYTEYLRSARGAKTEGMSLLQQERIALHAHALHLQQQAAIERLEKAASRVVTLLGRHYISVPAEDAIDALKAELEALQEAGE